MQPGASQPRREEGAQADGRVIVSLVMGGRLCASVCSAKPGRLPRGFVNYFVHGRWELAGADHLLAQQQLID